eukprot:5596016-Prymnesium_polylepis.1
MQRPSKSHVLRRPLLHCYVHVPVRAARRHAPRSACDPVRQDAQGAEAIAAQAAAQAADDELQRRPVQDAGAPQRLQDIRHQRQLARPVYLRRYSNRAVVCARAQPIDRYIRNGDGKYIPSGAVRAQGDLEVEAQPDQGDRLRLPQRHHLPARDGVAVAPRVSDRCERWASQPLLRDPAGSVSTRGREE